FRYMLQCEEGDPVYSDVVSVSLNAAEDCYCIPLNTSSSSSYITNIKTEGAGESKLKKSSNISEDGYADYTESDTLKVVAGDEIDLTATYSGGTSYVESWIDWDKDGSFEEEGDHVISSGSYVSSPYSESFEIPQNITEELTTRLRIRVQSLGGSPNSCDESGYGETEDYTIKIIPLEDCEGTPDAGEVMDDFSICAGEAFNIETEGASVAANNLTRVWQSSPAGENDWTDLSESNQGTNITIEEGIEEETDFRYMLQCGEDDPVYSDIIEVDLNPANECYCTPENNSSSTYYIENVSTEGALQDIDNSTDFADNGYGDYTDSHVIVAYPGQEFDFSITSSSSSMYYNIWIYLNQNGNFEDEGEHIASSDAYIAPPFTGTFEVPEDMEEGSYRIRIRSNWLGGSLDPCEDNGDGETEEYMLQVIYPDCFPPIGIEINYITDISAQVSWEANDESEWTVFYGEEGFDTETEGESITVDAPVAELTDLEEDTTYQVYVQTVCEDENSVMIGPDTFTTNITPPENTRLCDAIALEPNTGCIDGPYTNVAAFEESNEPTGSCLNDFHGTNSVWFTFEAPANGLATISTDFNSTDFLTEIVAFEAPTDCEDMTTLGEEVGCAEASENNVGTLELEGLNPGETYYVKVAGFNNTDGEFCIDVEMDESPVCPDPSDITIGEIGP